MAKMNRSKMNSQKFHKSVYTLYLFFSNHTSFTHSITYLTLINFFDFKLQLTIICTHLIHRDHIYLLYSLSFLRRVIILLATPHRAHPQQIRRNNKNLLSEHRQFKFDTHGTRNFKRNNYSSR